MARMRTRGKATQERKPEAPFGWRVEYDAATKRFVVYGPDGWPKAVTESAEEGTAEARRLAGGR